jgi:plasmid stability protein
MADILVRDVKPATHATLKKRAKEAGVSTQQYLREVLDRAARMTPEEFLEFVARVRAAIAQGGVRDKRDSLELIREDRRRRH